MFSCCKRMSSELGAATIEALSTMVVLIFALLLALVMGVSFYNLSLLNSAAQNITLNTQVQLDRYCSPQGDGADCAVGIDKANQLRTQMINQTQASLAFAGPIDCQVNFASCASASTSLNQSKPSTLPVAWPTGTPSSGGASVVGLPAGWGYNAVQLQSQQQLLGAGVNSFLPGLGGGLSIGARSMSTSYKDPDPNK